MDSSGTATTGPIRKYLLPIFLATLVPMFTGAAYLTGLAYHQAYLRMFHVPVSLVPISVDENFVYAYVTFSVLVRAFFESAMAVAVISSLIFFGTLQWLLMDPATDKIRQSRFAIAVRRWLSRRHRIRALGRLVFLPTAVTIGTIYFIFFVTVALVIPVELGMAAGRMVALEDKAAFQKNCNEPVGTRFCSIILEGDKELIKGYIIGGSEKNIVVFVGEKTTILARGDKTTITATVERKTIPK
jgi:hypothetical protein